jgi:hypothetical protein
MVIDADEIKGSQRDQVGNNANGVDKFRCGFSNNNPPEGAFAISGFLNLELTRPSMAGWYNTNIASPEW